MIREPEWDSDERAWMLGLELREDAECRRCGGVLAETTSPDFVWKAQLPIVCLKCAALRADEKAHQANHQSGAMIHRVTKQPRKPRTEEG